MSKFKSAKSTYGAPVYQDNNRILVPDSGFDWLSSRLKDTNSQTEFRILPSFDEAGEEELALNPEISSENPSENIGPCFCYVDVCTFWKNGYHAFISSVRPYDEAGNRVSNTRGPAYNFMRRVRYKIFEQKKRASMGMDTDIPEHWFNLGDQGSIMIPYKALLVQCLYGTVDGVSQQDADGNIQFVGPGIFMFPKSAENTFFDRILRKRNTKRPLSVDNNQFGDFYSTAEGCSMILTKSARGTKEKSKIEYSVSLGEKFPLDVEAARNMVKPWNEILYQPSVEEVISILTNAFDAQIVDYGLRGTPFHSYLSDNVKGSSNDIEEAVDVKTLTPIKTARPEQGNPHHEVEDGTAEEETQRPSKPKQPATTGVDREKYNSVLSKFKSPSKPAESTSAESSNETDNDIPF